MSSRRPTKRDANFVRFQASCAPPRGRVVSKVEHLLVQITCMQPLIEVQCDSGSCCCGSRCPFGLDGVFQHMLNGPPQGGWNGFKNGYVCPQHGLELCYPSKGVVPQTHPSQCALTEQSILCPNMFVAKHQHRVGYLLQPCLSEGSRLADQVQKIPGWHCLNSVDHL